MSYAPPTHADPLTPQPVRDLAAPAWTHDLPAEEFSLFTERVENVTDLTAAEFERRTFEAYVSIANQLAACDHRHPVRFWNQVPFITDPADAGRGRPNESIESAVRVLESLGKPDTVLTSLCGTWTDRAEAAALRRATPHAQISSLYGHTGEHFSATPLLALAGVLLTGKLPRMLHPLTDLRCADGAGRADRAAAICTDFTGCVSGALVARESPIRDA